jgi:hypothetical protein
MGGVGVFPGTTMLAFLSAITKDQHSSRQPAMAVTAVTFGVVGNGALCALIRALKNEFFY